MPRADARVLACLIVAVLAQQQQVALAASCEDWAFNTTEWDLCLYNGPAYQGPTNEPNISMAVAFKASGCYVWPVFQWGCQCAMHDTKAWCLMATGALVHAACMVLLHGRAHARVAHLGVPSSLQPLPSTPPAPH